MFCGFYTTEVKGHRRRKKRKIDWDKLFLGSESAGPRAAVLYTILMGAKRHHIEPWAYVRDLLLRLNADAPNLEEMLPDRWAAAHPDAILTHRLEESRAKAVCTRARRAHRRARQK